MLLTGAERLEKLAAQHSVGSPDPGSTEHAGLELPPCGSIADAQQLADLGKRIDGVGADFDGRIAHLLAPLYSLREMLDKLLPIPGPSFPSIANCPAEMGIAGCRRA